MLQTLLEERFKMTVHKDSRPGAAYALTVGKKPQIKEASGKEETGCRAQSPPGEPSQGVLSVMMPGPDGNSVPIRPGTRHDD